MAPATADFVKNLPKVELHVHLEGTLKPTLRLKLAKKHGITLPWNTAEGMQDSYKTWFSSVVKGDIQGEDAAGGFFDFYFGGMTVLLDEEDFYDLAMDFFTHSAAANVRYLELFFNPQSHTTRGILVETVFSGLRRAKKDAETNLNVSLK